MEDKVAVVTGGTKGIGAAVVHRLLGDGYAVITAARSVAPEQGERLTVVQANLGTAEGAATLAAAAAERGRVDALVNNVGRFEPRTSFLDITDAEWEESFAVNLLSAVRVTRALLPALLESKGAIVNISSINARLPFPSVVDYSAYKAGLSNLTKALSEEFAPRGVRVNAVSPGPVRTPGFSEEGGVADVMAAATGATHERVLSDEVPAAMGVAMGRMGEGDEVASAVAFLVGPGAGYITGADLLVDGGTIKTF